MYGYVGNRLLPARLRYSACCRPNSSTTASREIAERTAAGSVRVHAIISMSGMYMKG